MAKLLRDGVSGELPRCSAAAPSAQLQHHFQRTVCKSAGYLQLVSPGKVSRKIVSDALSKTSPHSPLSLAKLCRIRFIQASTSRPPVPSLQSTERFRGLVISFSCFQLQATCTCRFQETPCAGLAAGNVPLPATGALLYHARELYEHRGFDNKPVPSSRLPHQFITQPRTLPKWELPCRGWLFAPAGFAHR